MVHEAAALRAENNGPLPPKLIAPVPSNNNKIVEGKSNKKKTFCLIFYFHPPTPKAAMSVDHERQTASWFFVYSVPSVLFAQNTIIVFYNDT